MPNEVNTDNIDETITARMVDDLQLKPLAEFEELLDLKNLQGESTGYIKVYAGDRIEKASTLSIAIAPGMRYFNIHIIPDAHFAVPRYLFEGMLAGHGSQVSTELFTDVDEPMSIEHLKSQYGKVNEIYNEARGDDSIHVEPSRQMHMRAFSSPFFLCAFGLAEDKLAPMENYASRYFAEFLAMHKAAVQLGDSAAAAKEARRQYVAKTLIAEDPDRHFVVDVYGEATTQAIEAASML